MERFPIDSLPSVSEISMTIEKILKKIFRENYSKYVLKHDDKRYVILPPRYLHFPPILITIQEHPDSSEKALFLTISRRIPIDSREDIREILKSLGSIMSVSVEIIKRPWSKRDEKNAVSIYYLLLSSRIHSLSIKDKAWLLLALSSFIRLDENFMLEDEKPIDRAQKHFSSVEYT